MVCIVECCELPSGCVLERVLSAQRLDSLDIHGVFPLYQHIDKHVRDNPTARYFQLYTKARFFLLVDLRGKNSDLGLRGRTK